jgi:predicted RNase H-like HicB family nuclease/predicted RNA binding protein YcfA (HicA-like mRNA interferase family)
MRVRLCVALIVASKLYYRPSKEPHFMQTHYYKISIFINKEDDIYQAYCAELLGCHSQGDSYQEAQENIKEAVNLYLETFTEQQATECLSQTPAEEISRPSFDIQLRLTSLQAEKLLLGAGFAVAGSKDNHRIYLKDNSRFVLPLRTGRILSHKMAKEILDLVAA